MGGQKASCLPLGVGVSATLGAFAAAVVVAAHHVARRRQGVSNVGETIVRRILPGGRGKKRPAKKAASPRYTGEEGSKKWRRDPHYTQWHKDYVENEHLTRDPSTALGKEFRAKFRIPYNLFEDIVEATRASGLFPDEQVSRRGARPHPLSFKVMAALRRLALGRSFDGLEELSGISREVLSKFIPAWEQWFLEEYFEEHVRMPRNVEELEEAVNLFSMCGLPGCISSMDVVHVRYDRCPHDQRYFHTGRQHYSSLGFQFHASHNRRIYYVGQNFPGARNDKTVVRSDGMLERLASDPLYKDFEYTVYTATGEEIVMRGVWALCDGGYHKRPHTICGNKHADEDRDKAWSGLCESARKDVECVFWNSEAKVRTSEGFFPGL